VISLNQQPVYFRGEGRFVLENLDMKCSMFLDYKWEVGLMTILFGGLEVRRGGRTDPPPQKKN